MSIFIFYIPIRFPASPCLLRYKLCVKMVSKRGEQIASANIVINFLRTRRSLALNDTAIYTFTPCLIRLYTYFFFCDPINTKYRIHNNNQLLVIRLHVLGTPGDSNKTVRRGCRPF